MTVLPDAPYEVTAAFSEADAAKLKVGQPAAVTFDARPDAAASGTVTSVDIEPTSSTAGSGATSGSGVTTYDATITLDEAPDDLLQGMTASVVVTVNEVTDVLWLPTAAITTVGGQSTVTVRENNVDTVVTVTTGLAGDSGTEITSGLTAGQDVVIETSDSDTGFGGFPMGGVPGERRIGGGNPGSR
jgi:macrolide-specific efflux system membrane fusion protein